MTVTTPAHRSLQSSPTTRTAVRLDVGIARAALPPSIWVTGMVYDVHTGLVKVVDPATTE